MSRFRALPLLLTLLAALAQPDGAGAQFTGAYDRVQCDGVDFPRKHTVNFTGGGPCATVGSTTEVPVGSGSGSSSNSFETIATPAGTSPVADSATDTLTLSSSTGLTITGTAASDSIAFTLAQTLQDIAGLSPADNNFIVGNPAGTNFTVESGNTARTSLGLGTTDSPTFTGLTATGTINANGGTIASTAATLVVNAAGAIDLQDNVTADRLTLDTGALTLRNGESIDNGTQNRFTFATNAAGTPDTLELLIPTAGGASFIGTTTASDLSAARTWTYPDASGTVAVSASSPVTLSAAGDIACSTCVTTAGTLFTGAADTGTPQTIVSGDTLSILGGTNGIDTVASATDTVTVNLDTTEIGTTTFGTGAGIVWTFDAGAGTDPSLTFGANAVTVLAGTTTFQTATAVQDQLSILPFAAGAARFTGSFTSVDLTAGRSWTFPDASGTVAVAASSPITLSAAGTIACPTCLVSATTIITAAADTGSSQPLASGDTLSILGGTNGIDTVASATDTVTVNLDTTEIGSTTFGSGAGIAWTFDAGATDPVVTFGSNAVTVQAATTTYQTPTATDDQLIVQPQAAGAARFAGTVTSVDLTAARTYTLPNASGTVPVSATAPVTLSAAGDIACTTCVTTAGTLFTAAADTGTPETIVSGNTLSILGGTNGVDTVVSATDTVTVNLDTTEIGNTTFGSGSGITWTFDAGATDPTLTFGSAALTVQAATTTFQTATGTQDQLIVQPQAGGAARFAGTLTSTDLTAARTYTFPNASGTVPVSVSAPLALSATGNIDCPTCLTTASTHDILSPTHSDSSTAVTPTGGDLLWFETGAGKWEALPPGSNAQVLLIGGAAVPSWTTFVGDVAVNNIGATLIQNNVVGLNKLGALNTAGDLLSYNAGSHVRIVAVAAGQYLRSAGVATLPVWTAATANDDWTQYVRILGRTGATNSFVISTDAAGTIAGSNASAATTGLLQLASNTTSTLRPIRLAESASTTQTVFPGSSLVGLFEGRLNGLTFVASDILAAFNIGRQGITAQTWEVTVDAADPNPIQGANLFVFGPIIRNGSNNADRFAGNWNGLFWQPNFRINSTASGTFTINAIRPVANQAVFSRTGSTGSVVVRELTSVYDLPSFATGTEVTARRGLWYQNPSTITGVQRTTIAVDVDDQTVIDSTPGPAGLAVALRSALNVGVDDGVGGVAVPPAKWNLLFTGTAPSASLGSLRLGSGTTPAIGGSILHVDGGLTLKRRAIADAAGTVALDDVIIEYTSISATRALTLPTVANAGAGKTYIVKKSTSSGSTVNITPSGSETIEGLGAGAPFALTPGFASAMIYCSGSTWLVMAQ